MSIVNPTNFKVIENLLSDFMPFALERMGIEESPQIRFAKDPDNARNPLGKTGYYEPETKMITVYIDGRHPKDIMRSVSHELVHHAQNLRGDLAGTQGVGEQGYAQNNDHLREMEREAYEQGNLCFRDWEDGIKSENPNMYESLKRNLKESQFAATASEEAQKINAEAGIHLNTEQEYWERVGVRTGEELAIEILTGTYSDMFKSIHNIRPRRSFSSVEEVQAAIERLDGEMEAAIEQRKLDAQAEEEYRKNQELIASLMPNEMDVEYEKMPKRSGMGRAAMQEELNMFERRNIKLNQRLMESFGYKVSVTEGVGTMVYQPILSDEEWETGDLRTYEVFASEEEAQARFPNHEIQQLSSDDIEDAYWADTGEPVEQGSALEESSVEPKQGDDVRIIGGALTGAEGEVMELTTTTQGHPALVVYLRKDADKRIYGAAGDEVIVQPKFAEVDRGIQDYDDSDNPEDDYNWVGHRAHYQEVKRPVLKEASDAIEAFADAFWDNAENMPYGSEESDGALVLDYRGVVGAVIYEDEQGAYIDIDGLSGQIRDPIEAANAIDQMVSGGKKSYSTNAGDPSKGDPLYQESFEGDARSESDAALVDKIAELMASDPEFRILRPFVEKFVRYSRSGGSVESSLEAALPDWVAGRHIAAIMKKVQGGQIYQEGKYRSGEDTIYPDQHNHNLDMAQDSWEAANAQAREDLRNGTVDQEKLKYDEEYREAIEAQKGMMQEARPNFMGSDEEKEMMSKMSAKDHYKYVTQDRGRREMSPQEINAIESFNNWLNDEEADDHHMRQMTWEPAQSYRGGRVLAYNKKEGTWLDVMSDMPVSDEEMSDILPEAKLKVALKARLTEVFTKYPQLASNKDFINTIKEGVKNKIMENKTMKLKKEVKESLGDGPIEKALSIFPEAEVHEDGMGGYEILLDPQSLDRLESDPAMQAAVSDAFGDTWETTEDGILVDGGPTQEKQDLGSRIAEGVVSKLKERWGEDEFGSMFDSYDDDEDEMGLEPSPEEEEIEALLKQYGLSKDAGPAADAEAGAAAMADMEDDADLGRRPEDDEEDPARRATVMKEDGGMSVEQFADAFDLSPNSDQNGQVVFYAVDDGGIKAQEIHTQAQRSGFDVESDNDGQMVIYTHTYPHGQTDMGEGSGISAKEFAMQYGLELTQDNNGQILIYMDSDQAESVDFGKGTEDWEVKGLDAGEYVIYTNEYPHGQTDMDETHDHGWSDKRNTRLNEALMKWAIK